jgi:hypothetical protein
MKKEDLLLEAIEKRKKFQKKLEEKYKVKNFKYSNSEKQEEIESLEFKKVPPVLWFGDLNAEKPKVVVISANPHNPERCICKEQVWDENNPNIPQLIEDYNNYFKTDKNSPATNWFGKNSNEHKAENQARIEDFLNGLGASFYDKNDEEKYRYQAIHIDLLPLATTTDFSKIAKNLMEIDGLREFINEHISELIKLINPKLVIVNGVTNKKYFEECLSIIYPIKPKELKKYGSYTVNNKKIYNLRIWDFDNIEDSKVIAISRNMGTSCRVNKESLYSIGEEERKRLKL